MKTILWKSREKLNYAHSNDYLVIVGVVFCNAGKLLRNFGFLLFSHFAFLRRRKMKSPTASPPANAEAIIVGMSHLRAVFPFSSGAFGEPSA